MSLKKEIIEVDLVVDSRPLTKEEELRIEVYINADKAKRESTIERSPKKSQKKEPKKKVL